MGWGLKNLGTTESPKVVAPAKTLTDRFCASGACTMHTICTQLHTEEPASSPASVERWGRSRERRSRWA